MNKNKNYYNYSIDKVQYYLKDIVKKIKNILKDHHIM